MASATGAALVAATDKWKCPIFETKKKRYSIKLKLTKVTDFTDNIITVR